MGYLKNKYNGLVYGHGDSSGSSTSYSIDGKQYFKKSYKTWKNMLGRCYSEYIHKKQPTYIGCNVSKEWLNYATFEKWYDTNYVDGYELDKDILSSSSRGKLYSKETCKFVSRKENIDQRVTGKYYIITLPNGKEIEVYNLTKYCKENNLFQNMMSRVAKGKSKHHRRHLCRYA